MNVVRRMVTSSGKVRNDVEVRESMVDGDYEMNSSVTEARNPLQPSSAYMMSLRRAQEAERVRNGIDISVANARPAGQVRPGWWTILIAVFLFVGGILIFSIGAAVYWNTSDFNSIQGITKGQGMDMVIVGSISK